MPIELPGVHELISAYIAGVRDRERREAIAARDEIARQRSEEISRHNQELEKAAKDRIKQQEARDTALANYQKGQLDLATKGRKLEQLTKGADLLSKGVLQIPTRQFVPGQDVPVGNELNQLDEFGNVPEGTTRLDRESLGAALAQMGLDEDVAFNIANLSATPEQLEAQKLRAKVNEASAMTPVLAKRAAEIKKGTLPWEIQAELDKYNKITAVRDEQLFQNNRVIAQDNNAFRLKVEGARNSLRRELANKRASNENLPLATATERGKLALYNTLEKQLIELGTQINDPEIAQMFMGPMIGHGAELGRKILPSKILPRSEKVEKFRAALGQYRGDVNKSQSGLSLTKPELDSLLSYVPEGSAAEDYTTAKAKILQGLDQLKRTRQSLKEQVRFVGEEVKDKNKLKFDSDEFEVIVR